MNYAKYVAIAIALLFVIIVMAQSGKKFVLDEIDFPIAAKAASETGTPIYYRGDPNAPHCGTYHPTLYIHSLAFFIMMFGFSESVVRAFGMVCVLVTASILLLLYNKISRDSRNREAFGMVFLGLFLLHPYTIASATLPDIDSTVLPVTIAAFIYALIACFMVAEPSAGDMDRRRRAVGNARTLVVLGILFAFNLWAKLTTPVILPIAAFCLLVGMRRGVKESLLKAAIITVAGIAIFLASYWIYCTTLHLPFRYTFDFLIHSFTKGTSSGATVSKFQKISENLFYGKFFIRWLTIPAVVLYFVSLFCLVRKNVDQARKIVLVLAVMALAATLFYTGLISPFGGFFKYPFPVFPFFMFAIAFFVVGIIDFSKFTNVVIFMLGVIGVQFLEAHFWGDASLKNIEPYRYTFLTVLLSLALSVVVKKYEFTRFVRFLVMGLLIVTIGVSLGISRIQAKRPYPTRYHYGQMGMDETIAYLKSRVNKDESIWAMKDVGFYVTDRYVENYGYIFRDELQDDLIQMMQEGKVRYYVPTIGIGQDRIDVYASLKKILDTYGTVERTFGNFVIYSTNAKKGRAGNPSSLEDTL